MEKSPLSHKGAYRVEALLGLCVCVVVLAFPADTASVAVFHVVVAVVVIPFVVAAAAAKNIPLKVTCVCSDVDFVGSQTLAALA